VFALSQFPAMRGCQNPPILHDNDPNLGMGSIVLSHTLARLINRHLHEVTILRLDHFDFLATRCRRLVGSRLFHGDIRLARLVPGDGLSCPAQL
jgi:hypothetical protein